MRLLLLFSQITLTCSLRIRRMNNYVFIENYRQSFSNSPYQVLRLQVEILFYLISNRKLKIMRKKSVQKISSTMLKAKELNIVSDNKNRKC